MKSFTKNDTQVMKGIAIILMFFHHNFLDAERYKGYVVNFWPFSETTVNSVTLSFKICVGIFVFLSAYGITLGMKNKNAEYKFTAKETSRMVCNRYLKLMGGYLFIFAFVQIYSVIAGFHRYHVMYGKGAKSVFYFLIDGLGLAELFGTPTFNATWWYMSFAILLVFIMPLLVQWYKKQGHYCFYYRFR